MRGYPVPMLYIHRVSRQVEDEPDNHLYIIDGQQRILSLYEFREGAWKLFHPKKDDSVANFPNFVKETPCPWGGKSFEDFSDDLKKKFEELELPVVEIKNSEEVEVRDLFIRLQQGSPLNDQEIRDAWAGNFTDFVLRLGGKPEIPRYPGHDFFKKIMRTNPTTDRGKTRKLAAQIAMLFFEFHNSKKFCNIQTGDINAFYHKNIDFDVNVSEAKRLRGILDNLTSIFSDGMRKKIIGHEAIHLVLLLSSLTDDYVSGWEKELPSAFDKFRQRLIQAREAEKKEEESEFATYQENYGFWVRTRSDTADSIERRHRFFMQEMVKFLNLKKKDPSRSFTPFDRELIYFRDKKKCQVCIMNGTEDSQVPWEEADIHHVSPHSQGGRTDMDNAVLVHRHCHPKGDAQEKKFMEWWQANSRGKVLLTEEAEKHASENDQGSSSSNIDIQNPEDVKFSKITKATVAGKHLGKINWNKLVLYMIQLAFEKGLNFEKLRENLDSGPLGFQFFGIRKGDTNKVGWYYLEKEDVSIFNKEANNCLKVIKEFARILKVDFEIIFRYNNGKNAGKTGRWSS